MNNKNYVWLASAAVIAVVIVWIYNREATTQPNTANAQVSSQPQSITQVDTLSAVPVSNTASSSQSSQARKESANIQLHDRLLAMRERRPNLQFDQASVEAALQRQTTWQTAQKIPKHLPLKAEEFTDGRQFIQLDSLKIETLMPGDSVKISITDASTQDYTVTMDSVEKQDYNSISWYGHIDGSDGQTYQVSFTRGEKLTVGGLDTPEGHYVLQAHGNDGWIASSKLLFKIDPNVSDVVYPDEVQQH